MALDCLQINFLISYIGFGEYKVRELIVVLKLLSGLALTLELLDQKFTSLVPRIASQEG